MFCILLTVWTVRTRTVSISYLWPDAIYVCLAHTLSARTETNSTTHGKIARLPQQRNVYKQFVGYVQSKIIVFLTHFQDEPKSG